MTSLLMILLGMVVVFLLTVLTGYFVAQEFGYMAVDRSRLKAMAAAGDTGAERALGITRRTSFMLSGAQLGITVTGLLVGYVAEPLIGVGIGDLLGGVGVPQAVGIAVGTVLALLFSTVVQMVSVSFSRRTWPSPGRSRSRVGWPGPPRCICRCSGG